MLPPSLWIRVAGLRPLSGVFVRDVRGQSPSSSSKTIPVAPEPVHLPKCHRGREDEQDQRRVDRRVGVRLGPQPVRRSPYVRAVSRSDDGRRSESGPPETTGREPPDVPEAYA